MLVEGNDGGRREVEGKVLEEKDRGKLMLL